MRGMTVTFESKVFDITGKIGLKFSNQLFFVNKKPSYLQILLQDNTHLCAAIMTDLSRTFNYLLRFANKPFPNSNLKTSIKNWK